MHVTLQSEQHQNLRVQLVFCAACTNDLPWVWGYDKPHKPGAHDYLRVRDLMTGLLKKVPKVTVDTAYLFPTQAQFDKVDLVVMFLHLPQLTSKHYGQMDLGLNKYGIDQ